MIVESPRNLFAKLSVKWKAMIAMLVVVAVALLLAAIALALSEQSTYKRSLVSRLETLSRIIADNSAAVLVTHDSNTAEQTLTALKADPRIVAAAIYDEHGAMFASYQRAGADDLARLQGTSENGFEFDGAFLRVTQLIMLDGTVQGSACVVAETGELRELARGFAISAAIILLVVTLASFPIGLIMQRVVTGPVTRLSSIAKEISATRDFSIRARREAEDEIGILVDGFNNMLEEIEASVGRLRESDDRYQAAIFGAGVGIWDWNLTTGGAYYAPRFREMLGLAESDLPNERDAWMDFLHPDDVPRAREALRAHLENRQPYELDFRLRNANGQYGWYRMIGHAVQDDEQVPVRMAGSISDITTRITAEENLNRFVTLSTDLIGTANAEGYFVTANPAFTNVLGYTETELKTIPFVDLIHPEDVERTMREFAEALEGKRTQGFENRYRTKDGRMVWISWNGAMISQDLTFAVGRDITERRQTEEKLARYAEQLRRSNRELEDFATIASHDLQEPLRKVQAFSDRLASRCANQLDEQGKDYLNRMLAAVARMKTLINDLLDFSRVDSRGQPFTRVNLEQIAREVISDLEVLISSANADVIVDGLPVLEADPTQMRQLLQNLIGNAVKFRKPNEPASVRIRSKVAPGNGSAVSAKDTSYEITVEDNGIGFDQAYAEKIFTIFQRLHGRGEYEGTGVGLAVCRKIVERHRGNIVASSTLDEGSRFVFTLPATQEANEEGVK